MSDESVPGGWGPPLIGHTLKFGSDPIGFVTRHRAKYGPLFKTYVLRERGVSVATHATASRLLEDTPPDAYCASKTMVRMARDMYGDGLGLMDGEEYAYARERIEVSFGAATMEMAFPGMLEMAGRSAQALLDGGAGVFKGVAAVEGQGRVRVSNVYEHFKNCGYDVVLLLILGLRPEDPATDEFKSLHSAVWKAATSVPFNIPGSTYAAGQKAKVKIAEFLQNRVREQDETQNHSVFLHMLKTQPDSRGVVFENDEVALQLMWLTSPLIAKLVGSCVVALLVRLSENACHLARVRAEVDALDSVDYAACTGGLPFLRACITEAMRLDPPSIILQRYTTRPVACPVPGNDKKRGGGDAKDSSSSSSPPPAASTASIEIPQDHLVWFHTRVINRDAEAFPEPDAFHPDRWASGGEPMQGVPSGCPFAAPGLAPAPPTATFGLGPRRCVGEPMSLLLLTVVAARVIRDLEWSLEGDPHKRKFIPTSRPEKAVAAVFTPRRK